MPSAPPPRIAGLRGSRRWGTAPGLGARPGFGSGPQRAELGPVQGPVGAERGPRGRRVRAQQPEAAGPPSHQVRARQRRTHGPPPDAGREHGRRDERARSTGEKRRTRSTAAPAGKKDFLAAAWKGGDQRPDQEARSRWPGGAVPRRTTSPRPLGQGGPARPIPAPPITRPRRDFARSAAPRLLAPTTMPPFDHAAEGIATQPQGAGKADIEGSRAENVGPPGEHRYVAGDLPDRGGAKGAHGRRRWPRGADDTAQGQHQPSFGRGRGRLVDGRNQRVFLERFQAGANRPKYQMEVLFN